ncbi:MAG: hypothetical protein J6C45_05845 [Alistipes sp.]|nr:hypothetical protein [Alistipes sp.]
MKDYSIEDLKKMLGLHNVLRSTEAIQPKRDGSKLYYVMGYTMPIRWETIESRGISYDRIIEEVDRAERREVWRKERQREEERRVRIQENNENKPF